MNPSVCQHCSMSRLVPRCHHWSCGPAWHLCVVTCEQQADLVILINTVFVMALAGCDLCVPKTQGGKLLRSQCSGKPPRKWGKGGLCCPLPPCCHQGSSHEDKLQPDLQKPGAHGAEVAWDLSLTVHKYSDIDPDKTEPHCEQ